MLSHRLSRSVLGMVCVGALLCCAACTDAHREDLQFTDTPPQTSLAVPEAPLHDSQFSTAPPAQPEIGQPYTTPPVLGSR